MPTYNYYCPNCGSHSSYFQKMSDSAISKCEECGENIQRVITGGTGLIFKGTGFYLTDYVNKKTEKDNSETKAENTKSTKDNSETKAENTKSTKDNNNSKEKS